MGGTGCTSDENCVRFSNPQGLGTPGRGLYSRFSRLGKRFGDEYLISYSTCMCFHVASPPSLRWLREEKN